MGLRLDPATEALLRVARAEYARSLPGKLAGLEALVAARAWTEARRATHRLRGSAATYGFDQVGALASTLEALLIEAGEEPEACSRERLDRQVRDLGVEIERVGAEAP